MRWVTLSLERHFQRARPYNTKSLYVVVVGRFIQHSPSVTNKHVLQSKYIYTNKQTHKNIAVRIE